MMNSPTPLSRLELDRQDEVFLLRSSNIDYADGAEEALLSLVQKTENRSADSSDLFDKAESWVEQYHLSSERANAIRMLSIDREDVVLEIGAGCGAVTRWLAENAKHVDAVEPVFSRAKVCAARVEGTTTKCYQGELKDVPAEPAYSVILVNGVLEYVGEGKRNESPYIEFIAEARKRLLPGGCLVIAIENKLGVKYLAGAPEDHGGIPYQGVEDYVVPAPARTFSRFELTEIIRKAGLHSTFLAAFPDYKFTRTLLSDKALIDQKYKNIAWRFPRFPSPAYTESPIQGPSEQLLWRTFVEGNVAHEMPNSFVVIAASQANDVERLWPTNKIAAFISMNRQEQFRSITSLDEHEDTTLLTRRRTSQKPATSNDLELVANNDVFYSSRDVPTQIAKDFSLLTPVLKEWLTLVDDLDFSEKVPVDLVPHNLLLNDSGRLIIIDQEWYSYVDKEVLIARGFILLSRELSTLCTSNIFNGATTIEEAAQFIAKQAGTKISSDVYRKTLDWESKFQVDVTGHSLETIRDSIVQLFKTQPLSDLAPHSQNIKKYVNRIQETTQLVHALRSETKVLRDEIAVLRKQHKEALDAHDLQSDRAVALEEQLILEKSNHQEKSDELNRIYKSRSWQLIEKIRSIKR